MNRQSLIATIVGGAIALALIVGWIVQSLSGHQPTDAYVAVTSASVGHFLSGASALSTAGQVGNAPAQGNGQSAGSTSVAP